MTPNREVEEITAEVEAVIKQAEAIRHGTADMSPKEGLDYLRGVQSRLEGMTAELHAKEAEVIAEAEAGITSILAELDRAQRR